jgi:hypothetical protein
MPLTTTAQNACNVSLWLRDAGGTDRDISGSSNSVGFEFTLNLGDVNAFQNQWPVRLDCGKDVTISLEVLYTQTANEGWDVLKDWYFAATPGARQFTAYVPDKNVGSDRFNGLTRLESLSFTATAGEADPILVSASLRSDGEFSHSDVAT